MVCVLVCMLKELNVVLNLVGLMFNLVIIVVIEVLLVRFRCCIWKVLKMFVCIWVLMLRVFSVKNSFWCSLIIVLKFMWMWWKDMFVGNCLI